MTRTRTEEFPRRKLPDQSLTKIWFLYDLDKDDYLDANDWQYLLARNNTKNGLYAIKLGGRGDVTKSHVLWRHEKGLPNIPSPLLYHNVLFMLREGGILTSVQSDGRHIFISKAVLKAQSIHTSHLPCSQMES